jgi:hypothetical protein
MYWLIGILLLAVAVALFVVIARRGRKLRTTRVLPGQATQATLEDSAGKTYSIEPATQFYMGVNPASQVVLAEGGQDYSVCIFYHRRRFAFQTYTGEKGIRVNGEEQLAGYLGDGDVLEIAGERFTFRCR